MSKTVLFELGLEEMPARFIDDALNQLTSNTEAWFKENRIPYGTIKGYATPRRLAISISEVAEQQPDIEEEAKGPAKKIALDEEGNWSKAAIGFSKGQGQTVDDIYFKEIKGIEYAHVNKFIKGESSLELLTGFKEVLLSLNFPKNMRWGSYDLRFIRPIRWVVALYGETVIPFEIENVTTGKTTYGHRFLGDKATVAKADEYEMVMGQEYVFAEKGKRKQVIVNQLDELEKVKNWTIMKDEELLNEVNHLVEYPTVFSGSFSEEFLEVPEEALITSMKEHQRYFPVRSKDGSLLPHFVAVRNGNDEHLDTVAKGNEKVLKARLSDAQFFYREDQKGTLEEKLAKLERMVYQEELGTLADKVDRVKTISGKISSLLKLSKAETGNTLRAAQLCKFDLVTHMVDEFSELQGIMGEKYARLFGEEEEVAVAIREHYMPTQAGGELPVTTAGSIVSIADKLDTIIGSISIGIIPTGSQDPYGLRRQALGVLQILKKSNWAIEVEELLNIVHDLYTDLNLTSRGETDVRQDVQEFFKVRASYLLKDGDVASDIIEAVLAGGIHVYPVTLEKSKILADKRQDPDFKSTQEALGRVLNLAKKANTYTVDPDLFENNSEVELSKVHQHIHEDYLNLMENQQPEKALRKLAELTEPIHSFFDQTMVMAENEKVKMNRLGLLNQISNDITLFANFNAVQWKQQF
ncbi:glycine--tRNA ligase subunit beta [Halobacillus shinanisalinarum]|uniref:Glycine--tRNA ligase beta subunit n=1 Tax=Halobacillus shinanisalinarum TaxID=2932258 RepID=A0ABY4H0S4_9BACI|nr:glycine--tRNA ligase subunit beta [Halobacillus shinanisalinarum]UOQ93768.1 glycine--tRNA ligase subunit beta [Halobacillus shinanisalinarum]